MVAEEIPLTATLIGALPSGEYLQRRINEECIRKRFNGEDAGFFGMFVAAVQSMYEKDASQGGAGSGDHRVRDVTAGASRAVRQGVKNLLIKGNQRSRSRQKKRIPLQVRTLGRRGPELLLVLEAPFDDSTNETFTVGWVFAKGVVERGCTGPMRLGQFAFRFIMRHRPNIA